MSTSIQSARAGTAATVAPAGALAEAGVARGVWLPIAWGVVVVLCLAFWIGLAVLLVALS